MSFWLYRVNIVQIQCIYICIFVNIVYDTSCTIQWFEWINWRWTLTRELLCDLQETQHWDRDWVVIIPLLHWPFIHQRFNHANHQDQEITNDENNSSENNQLSSLIGTYCTVGHTPIYQIFPFEACVYLMKFIKQKCYAWAYSKILLVQILPSRNIKSGLTILLFRCSSSLSVLGFRTSTGSLLLLSWNL